jgi:CheY-like chemotaxis protein
LELEGAQSREPAWEGFSFKQHVRDSERTVIERALRDAGGSVTKAAHLLGFRHHQSLVSLINTRHTDLLKARSKVRKRRRPVFSKSKKSKKDILQRVAESPGPEISILHVEDNQAVARVVQETLDAEGMHVDSCLTGTAALDVLKSPAPYDLIIVDNELPGLSGLELVLRLQTMGHRRNTPVIMLSGADCEAEAWRAGVKEFLRKPGDIQQIASKIKRLLPQRKQERK